MSKANVSKAEKKAEAVKRLQALYIFPNAIRAFRGGRVMVSEAPFGALYDLNDEQKQMVSDFEKKNNALVYMVVRSNTEFGLLDSLLFVGDSKEEWAYDWEDLKSGYVFAYVVNHNADWCSEFGTIQVKTTIGRGLVRVA